jgi:excisionase family DNA binding protein
MTETTTGNTRAGPREGAARRAGRAEAKAREADPRPLLTVRETADHLRVSPRTVYRLIHEGQLRTVSIASELRVRPVDLDAYLSRAAS